MSTTTTIKDRQVTFTISSKTRVIVYGIAVSNNPQRVYTKLYKSDGTVLSNKDGIKEPEFTGQKNEALEIEIGDGPTVAVWGPFGVDTTLQLTFDHGRDENITGKVIKDQKHFSDASLKTKVTMVSYDNGITAGKTVVDATVTVVQDQQT